VQDVDTDYVRSAVFEACDREAARPMKLYSHCTEREISGILACLRGSNQSGHSPDSTSGPS